jgi:hypothetical protein
MKSHSGRRSQLSMMIALMLQLATGLSVLAKPIPQSSKEWEWVDKHYDSILNDLLPMKRIVGSYVTFRTITGLHSSAGEEPEPYFLIGFDRSDKGYGINAYVSARVRIADTISIYNQIMDMHRKNSSLSARDIEGKIKMKSLDFTETTCPAAKEEFREFQNLRFGPPYTNPDQLEVMLDARSYEFHITATHGDADMVLYDKGHPLVVWAMKTLQELEACSPTQDAQTNHH